jgi:hypothetical protein
MKIESYSFGNIVIDGSTYTSDLIIFPDRGSIWDKWWRKEGHAIHEEDLNEVMEEPPEILIIGTGESGRLKVSETIKTYIESQGITLKIAKTKDACKLFNELSQKNRVIAALHLTC